VHNPDATFVIVRQRHADLRRLAGPEPMIPLAKRPLDATVRLIARLASRLRHQPGSTATDPFEHPTPIPTQTRVLHVRHIE
jgi:hypothetical protein